MRVWHHLSEVPADCGATVVTIGKFDGIHLGHQALIQRAIDLAEQFDAMSTLVTFDRHPDALLHPDRARLPLIGPEQKENLVRASGVQALLTLPFDAELAALDPEDFVRLILNSSLNTKHLVVGEDFRFGRGGLGDLPLLRQLGLAYGFDLHVVPAVQVAGHKVSSTLVRSALDSGDVRLANALLGRNHSTEGIVEHGRQLGRQLGYPTANLSRNSEGYLPLDGVYAGWLTCNGQRHPAALSVGINETVKAVPRLLEAYVLHRDDLDLYDLQVVVEYIDFIRPTAKFSGIDELVAAIANDVAQVEAVLNRD